MIDKTLWELQKTLNENTNLQIQLLTKQIGKMLDIIEDHEQDMKRMVETINDLHGRVSRIEESLD